MKRRLISAAVVQILLTTFALLLAYNLDCIVSGRGADCALSLMVAGTALVHQRVLTFFLLFTALSALAVFCMVFGREYIHYKSDMQRLTPDLEIPMSAGQGQYGTAHWLEPGRLPQVFTVVRVDEDAPLLRRLIQEAEIARGKEAQCGGLDGADERAGPGPGAVL